MKIVWHGFSINGAAALGVDAEHLAESDEDFRTLSRIRYKDAFAKLVRLEDCRARSSRCPTALLGVAEAKNLQGTVDMGKSFDEVNVMVLVVPNAAQSDMKVQLEGWSCATLALHWEMLGSMWGPDYHRNSGVVLLARGAGKSGRLQKMLSEQLAGKKIGWPKYRVSASSPRSTLTLAKEMMKVETEADATVAEGAAPAKDKETPDAVRPDAATTGPADSKKRKKSALALGLAELESAAAAASAYQHAWYLDISARGKKRQCTMAPPLCRARSCVVTQQAAGRKTQILGPNEYLGFIGYDNVGINVLLLPKAQWQRAIASTPPMPVVRFVLEVAEAAMPK